MQYPVFGDQPPGWLLPIPGNCSFCKRCKTPCLSFHYLQISQLKPNISSLQMFERKVLKSNLNVWKSQRDVSKQMFCKQPDLCAEQIIWRWNAVAVSRWLWWLEWTLIYVQRTKEQKHADQYWTKYMRRMLLHEREMHISLTTKLQKHFSGMHPCRNLQEAL